MNQTQSKVPSFNLPLTSSISIQLLAVLIASLAATTANVILYLILKNLLGVKFIAPEQFPPPEVSPLPVSDVIIFSAVFSIGAGLVFLITANTVQQPARVFATISIIVLIFSCYLPFRIPTPPVPMLTKMSLVSMHILGAAVLVPLLIGIGLPRKTKEDDV